VIANKEENRQLDVRRLRDAGVPVWVTVIETVPQAIDSLTRLFTDGPALGRARLARRRPAGLGPTGPPCPGPGGGANLARPLDGGRPEHGHR
jgi:hypothetical protein